jgi:tetratricopeptide (TPR) repeat protein
MYYLFLMLIHIFPLHAEQLLPLDRNEIIDSTTAASKARTLTSAEKYEDAIVYFEQAIAATYSTDFQLLFEYANTLNTINQTHKALALYQQLLEQRPQDSSILYNIAYTLKKLGRIQEAMPYYQATLQRKPDHAEAHFSLGLAYLISGDFKKGWQEYEWRWKRNAQLVPRTFAQPLWDGCSLQGKTIFLYAEQGLGDTFQFVRYAKMIKEQYNATIIVAVQPPLKDIISSCCPYIDTVITLNQMPSSFDYHAPLMSLPRIVDTQLDTIPADIP